MAGRGGGGGAGCCCRGTDVVAHEDSLSYWSATQTVIMSQSINTITLWRESDHQDKNMLFFECHRVRRRQRGECVAHARVG